VDYKYFEELYFNMRDKDYPDRACTIAMLRRFLNGTAYDVLQYPFGQIINKSGYDGAYTAQNIPMSQRRPSVISTLCNTVVDDSVSFLFGEGRFPQIDIDDEKTQEIVNDIVNRTCLPDTMIELAHDGSVGSAALLIQVINSKIYYKSLHTEFLTPVFDKKNPNLLVKLTQKYKCKGSDLMAQGYKIEKPDFDYWIVTEWDENNETYYLPYLPDDLKKADFKPKIDKDLTIEHGLGFVPVLWIRNLSGGDFIDGQSTFKKAITTNIQLDYQLSQCARGLTYSQEPLLFYKNPDSIVGGDISPGTGQILHGGEGSDAKMIEINGDACRASIEYQKVLRDVALENIHGNRSTAERGINARSGKALELLHHPVMLLASRLRISYGEFGLVEVVKMIIKILKLREIKFENIVINKGSIKEDVTISLRWPNWFDDSSDDKHKEALTLGELKNAGILSQETAVYSIAEKYGIDDVKEEVNKINAEQKKFIDDTQPKVQEIFKS